MSKTITVRTYLLWFVLLLIPLSVYPFAVGSNWISCSDTHGTLEISAALFALCAACVILARFFSIGDWLYLIIGLGFLIAGAEDLVHGVISLERLSGPLSGYERFIPGTYVAGRLALVLMFITGAILQEKKTKVINARRKTFIYAAAALIVALLTTYIAVKLPLPRFIFPGRIISRPVDLVVGLFYVLAVFLYINLYSKDKEPFHWSLVASLIFGAVTQLYMVHSQRLYDAQFDLSHLFKIISYICPVLGAGIGTILLYRKEEALSRELSSSKTELENWSRTLEKRVDERTADLKRSQEATLHILEDLQVSKDELEEKSENLDESLKKAEKSREMMVSMLDDNNRIRRELEKNLTELKSTQGMLVQSEKLASLGKLVSDMAHEVNNPLMVISGRAQLSLMEDIKNKEIVENLRIVKDECMRAKDIIQRLLMFSKPSRGELAEVDINKTIDFTVKLIEHQFSLVDIKIVTNYLEDIPPVKIDEKQMHEVFMNLLKNSSEAISKGGTITITTSRERDNVRMDFTDTGEGIPEENLRKIFDPFFTTKESGTGLGLSVCYGIVNGHGGRLIYTSRPGEGTTATILLPIAEKGERS